jgi:exodeoxyribonuclease VII small subunit
MNKKDYPFEKAFERLEEILKILNEKAISLSDSLKLFEEANFLISNCSKKLNDAEKKIEILIKNRDKLEVNEDNMPKIEEFSPTEKQILKNE